MKVFTFYFTYRLGGQALVFGFKGFLRILYENYLHILFHIFFWEIASIQGLEKGNFVSLTHRLKLYKNGCVWTVFLSRGLTDESLAALPVPTLVIAAGVPSHDLPAELESANLAKRLPAASSRYVEISDASHFSFLSMCKPGAQAMLEEEVPGDGIICLDGENGRPREVIQQQVTSLIAEFLQSSVYKEGS